SLVSFVRLTADATASDRGVQVRFTPSARKLTLDYDTGSLVRGENTFLYLGEGAQFDGSAVTYAVPAHTRETVYLAWFVAPAPSRIFTLDEASYLIARQALVDYWTSTLWNGATFEVPEQRVNDAVRSLLIQN